MKNIIKRFLLYLLLLSSLITNAGPGDPCALATLVSDLSTSGTEFKTVVKESDGFNAWLVLNKEAPDLRTNIDALKLVSKNLDEISQAGGYLKWKNTINANQEIKLLGESKIKYISGLTPTENSIIYTEGNKIIAQSAEISKSKRPGAGSVLVKDSKFTSAVSNKTGLKEGELPPGIHPLVYEWFKNPTVNAEELVKRGQHGKCAEPEAISKWLYEYEQRTKIKIANINEARDVLKGTKSIAFETTTVVRRATGEIIAEIGDVKPACISCNPFLDYFGVEEIKVNINIKIE
ncbi:YwqJ-related putative deaminase [Flavobacterium collinsii]|uniref:YwqJ-related putative deaminase n=1 Tax=Flavobacterium collinsii TaxID=1114861 RepID=UPI003757F041